jgi:hypothetical protein
VLAEWSDPSIAREEFIKHPDYETARIATASALRLHWSDSSRDRELLNRLLQDSSPDVVRQAIVTSGLTGYREAMPFLIEKLADKRLRNDARDALLKLGGVVIPELVRRLSDKNEPFAVRMRIPKTLALMGTPPAAAALIDHIHALDYHLDYVVMKALNRLRINTPELAIDTERVTAAIAREREEYDRLSAIRACLETNPKEGRVVTLLMLALAERLEQRLERSFRLVALIYSPHDIYSVYYNCRIKPALRPSAIEFLDNLLDAPIKEMVVPLLEEACDPERPARGQQQVQYISHEAALEALITGEDPWLKSIAIELRNQLGERVDERTDRRVNAD